MESVFTWLSPFKKHTRDAQNSGTLGDVWCNKSNEYTPPHICLTHKPVDKRKKLQQ